MSGAYVGCGGIRRLENAENEPVRFEVKHLWMQPSARGRGWGRMLLAELEQRAAHLGAAEVVLDTNVSLATAGALYQSTGYEAIPSYNDNPNAAGVINPASIQEFGADWSFDLEVGVTFDERFRVAAGAENLFNRYPDRDVRNLFSQTGAAANGRIYNDASPLSYMGGFWYLRASAKF